MKLDQGKLEEEARPFENVGRLKYCRITNQNLMYDEDIKSRLNSGNDCYHSVQNLLSSPLPPNNLKIKIYKTIILPVVLYGCETARFTIWPHRYV
jgi:hypothetical protein